MSVFRQTFQFFPSDHAVVHALYESIYLRRLLSFLFCAEAVIMTTILVLNIPKIKLGEQCAVLGMPVVAIGFLCVIHESIDILR